MKNVKYYLLSFLLPVGLLFIASILGDYIPFGNYTFNVFDAFYEYPTFIAELGNLLRNGESIFYTLHGGFGVNFFSILNLYVGSPLNLFSVFFDNTTIYIFYTLLIYLKIGLAGLIMYIYLNSLNTKYKNSWGNVLFALIYALSGYAVAFCMHVMWMDIYVLLPIVIKYLDKLIIEDNSLLYILMLGLTIIVNYYLGFMVCIFLVIYFVYKALITNNFNKKKIFKFLGSSLLAGMLSAIVIVPTFFNLLGGRFNDLYLPASYFSIDWFTLFSHAYNMTLGSFIMNDNYNFGTTTVYITIFGLVLIIYYFFNKNIKKRDKIITGSVLLFFTISFSFALIDYAWNMFQIPIWWSHRYQFVYVFFTVVLAYISFCNMDRFDLKRKYKNIILVVFSLLTLGSLSYKLMGLGMPDVYVWFWFISLILFFVYIYFYKKNLVFLILVVLELVVNSYQLLSVNRGYSYDYMTSEVEKYNNILDNILDKDDYQIANIASYEDLGLLHGFNSLQLFSSSYNMDVAVFLDNLNVSTYNLNHQTIDVYNPAVLSLLGVKYYIGESNYLECSDNICVNNYAMPRMYDVNNKVKDIEISEDYVLNINNIYSVLLDREVILIERVDEELFKLEDILVDSDKEFYNYGENAQITVSYTASKRSMIIPNRELVFTLETTKFKINGEEYEYKKENSDNVIILNEGDTIQISYDYLDGADFNLDDCMFSVLDLDLYLESIEEISNNIEYENLKDNDYVLKGIIEAKEEVLVINMPYDEGIKVYVDGKEVSYYRVYDTLLGVDITPGKHEVAISYVPKGLKSGAGISIGTLIFVILFVIKKKITY